MDKVVIYGAGGLGSQVLDILRQAGQYEPVAFLDSDPRKWGQRAEGLPIAGSVDQLAALAGGRVDRAIVAVGDNVARVALAETLRAHGLRLVSAIHPLATISPSATIAEHVVIGPRATICVHAHVGEHTICSAGVIAEHDNWIGQGVFLEPAVRLAGGVRVDDFATVRIGASVIPGRRVGNGARVEAGAVVIHDVPPGAIVSGVPATTRGGWRSGFVPDEPIEEVPGGFRVPSTVADRGGPEAAQPEEARGV